ncbi:MAG: ATP synthase F1 subunit epsilon [Culicoidibacterales bacterium]
MALDLYIVATDRIIFEGEAEYVKVHTLEGQITVYPGHIPYVAVLDIAPLYIKTKENEKERQLAVGSGYMIVEDKNEVIIVTDIAEWAEEIDMERAQDEADRARRLLEGKELGDLSRAEISLRKAINRLNVTNNSTKID